MKKGNILELEITDLAFGGKGLAKKEGVVIFIDGTLPGQTVKVKITQKKRNYLEGKLLEVLSRSDLEVENPYQEIPGAPWAKLPVAKQMEFKKSQVFELFKKFAEVDLIEKAEDVDSKTEDSCVTYDFKSPFNSPFSKGGVIFDEAILSPEAWNYRNKMEFSFGCTNETQLTPEISQGLTGSTTKKIWQHTGFGLGSKKRGQFFLVENLEHPSGIFDAAFESFLPVIRDFCEHTGLPVYNQRTGEGFFRHLVVRKSFFQDQFLVNLVTTSFPSKEGEMASSRLPGWSNDFVKLLTDKFGNKIGGIFWTKNDDEGDTAQNFEDRRCLYGAEKLIEKINNLEFEISIDSFFQTNPAAAGKLYEKVVKYAEIPAGGLALDLYCGTGTIGQILGKNFSDSRIIGVEIVEVAVSDAQENARRNNLKNVEFFCEDVRRFLKFHPEFIGKIDLVVLDPPRSGLSPKALQRAIDLGTKKIIYLSCNPATMARDTKVISDQNYTLKKLSVVDQFPHTSHVECVGVFEKV